MELSGAETSANEFTERDVDMLMIEAVCSNKLGSLVRRGHWRAGLKKVGSGPCGYLGN